MRQISLCLTHWNRADIIQMAFEQVVYDARITEIIISDDRSDADEYARLLSLSSDSRMVYRTPVNVYRNDTRLGVGGNKARAISLASNEWCIIFDSDNVLDTDYLDKLFNIPEWEPDTIYAPSFAKPHFDYRMFQGKTISKTNVRQFIGKGQFAWFLNTGNYFVHRDTFTDVYEHLQVKGADSIYILYLWLRAGNKVVAVPGLHYEHAVHNGSYYQSVAGESAPVCEHYEKLIGQL